MNEEINMTPQEQDPETAPQVERLPRAKRTALIRYIAILFVFAFLIVLLSLFLQFRSTTTKQISDLTSASNSAIARAEQLQDENLALKETVKQLRKDAEDAQKAHEEELVKEQEVYDALMLLLTKPRKKIAGPKFVEAVKTVTEGKEKLSQTAWEKFTAYAEEEGLKLETTEETTETEEEKQ
ncbi:MAG: hypothetical protein IKC04_07970 [Oscillospiraceae bacterium]|nr:hypothetical protein [Oscillospiraceae bacterium]